MRSLPVYPPRQSAPDTGLGILLLTSKGPVHVKKS
uniref:Uncharacterized protein n=1 Tax=Anguilla anguilla TaxID=7936 RepID=A0A0E9UCD8_ANGAN